MGRFLGWYFTVIGSWCVYKYTEAECESFIDYESKHAMANR